MSDECKNIWNKIKEKKAGVMKQNSKVSKECAFQGSGRNFACLVFNTVGPDWDKSKQVRHDINYFICFRYHYHLGCWPPYPGHPRTAYEAVLGKFLNPTAFKSSALELRNCFRVEKVVLHSNTMNGNLNRVSITGNREFKGK